MGEVSQAQQANITRWTRIHAVAILLGSIGAWVLHHPLPMILMPLLSFGYYFQQQYAYWQPLGFLGGPANWATTFRLLAFLVLLWVAPSENDWLLCLWALAVLSLDGLDGWLARKTQTASVFGEYLDKETDAFYMMGMSWMLFYLGIAGPWVMLLGWIRYVYVLALIRWQPSAQKETRFPWGRIIAVVLMIGVALVFVLPPGWELPVLVVLCGLLLFSFGRSFLAMTRT